MLNSLIQIKFAAALGSSIGNSFKSLDNRINALSGSVSNLKVIQKRTNDFRSMSQKLKEANLNLTHHQKNLEQLNKRLKEKGKLTQREISQQANLTLKVKKSTNAYKDQKDRLSNLSSELKSAGVDTNNLASAQERLASKIKASSNELGSMRGTKNARINKQMKANQSRSERGSAAASVMGAIVATGASLANPVLFEREMSRTSMLAKNNLKGKEKENYKPDELKNSILDIGKNYTFSSRAAARTAGDYAQSGFSPSEIKGVLASTFNIATISRQAPEAVAGLMRSLKSSFGMDASNKNQMGYLSNVIMKSSNTSDADVGSLIESSKYLGGMPKESGLSLNETFAMLSTMSPTLKGSEAGTSTVQLLEKLSRKATREKLKKDMDIDVMKDGKMRHVFDILEDVKTRTKDLDKGKKLNLLTEIFDTQASRAIIPLISNMKKLRAQTKGLSKEFFKLNKEQNDGKDYTTSLKEIADNNSYGAIMRVVSALDIVSVRLYSLFQEQLQGAADAIASTINRVGSWIEKNKELTLYLAKLTACLGIATIAFKVLKIAMSFSRMTPMGLVITGLTTVAILAERAYKKFDWFKKIVDDVWAKAKEFFNWISNHKYMKLFLDYGDRTMAAVSDFFSPEKEKKIGLSKDVSIKKSSNITDSRQFKVNMSIHTTPNQSSNEVAEAIDNKFRSFMEEKNQAIVSDGLYDSIGAF